MSTSRPSRMGTASAHRHRPGRTDSRPNPARSLKLATNSAFRPPTGRVLESKEFVGWDLVKLDPEVGRLGRLQTRPQTDLLQAKE